MLEANRQLLTYVAKLTTQLKTVKEEKTKLEEQVASAQTLKPEVLQAIESALTDAKEVLGEV